MNSARGAVTGRTFLVVLVLLALGASAWLVFVRKDERVAVGSELVFDDFGFRVEPANATPLVTGLAPLGELKIVRVRVSNHAKVVSYTLDHHKPLLVDADGREYAPLAKAVEGVGTGSPPIALAAGDSCVQELYFDVPKGAREPRLKVSWGALGDRLDYVLIGDKSLALP